MRSCGAVCRPRLPADIPAAASGVRPGAAVRFSSPPAFVPRAMRPGADAVVRRRLPAAASGGPSRRSTSLPDVIRRTDVFRWPESRQRAFPPARLCVCCVCALRCGAALRSRPDRGTALPVGEPVSAGPSCRGAVYRGRRREAVRRVFRPPLEICLFGKALEQRKYKRAVRNLSDSLFRIVFHC